MFTVKGIFEIKIVLIIQLASLRNKAYHNVQKTERAPSLLK